jgi:hypothetical protein
MILGGEQPLPGDTGTSGLMGAGRGHCQHDKCGAHGKPRGATYRGQTGVSDGASASTASGRPRTLHLGGTTVAAGDTPGTASPARVRSAKQHR